MTQSTITLIIIACTCILYLTEKFSVAVTTVMGMLALIFTGILAALLVDCLSYFTKALWKTFLPFLMITPSPSNALCSKVTSIPVTLASLTATPPC